MDKPYPYKTLSCRGNLHGGPRVTTFPGLTFARGLLKDRPRHKSRASSNTIWDGLYFNRTFRLKRTPLEPSDLKSRNTPRVYARFKP